MRTTTKQKKRSRGGRGEGEEKKRRTSVGRRAEGSRSRLRLRSGCVNPAGQATRGRGESLGRARALPHRLQLQLQLQLLLFFKSPPISSLHPRFVFILSSFAAHHHRLLHFMASFYGLRATRLQPNKKKKKERQTTTQADRSRELQLNTVNSEWFLASRRRWWSKGPKSRWDLRQGVSVSCICHSYDGKLISLLPTSLLSSLLFVMTFLFLSVLSWSRCKTSTTAIFLMTESVKFWYRKQTNIEQFSELHLNLKSVWKTMQRYVRYSTPKFRTEGRTEVDAHRWKH